MTTDNTSSRKLSRREAVIFGAVSTLALTGRQTPGIIFGENQLEAATTIYQTPGQTEGPYWLDPEPNRSDVRTNTSTGAIQNGFPLKLTINVSKLNGTTAPVVSGAKVDIWHCNAAGLYSGVSANNTVGQNFLRGYQTTNSAGNVSFTSVYPGWYSGRTVHIHFRVRLYTGTALTYNFVSQLYFNETITNQVYAATPYSTRKTRDTLNTTDKIYTGASQGNGRKVTSNSGQYLLLTLSKTGTQANASFTVVL